MKKILSAMLCLMLCLCLLPAATLADRGREPLYILDLDKPLKTAADHTARFFKGRYLQVKASVPEGSNVELTVYMDKNERADGDDSTVFSQTFDGVPSKFVSPEIFLEYKGSETIPYRVELRVNGTTTHSTYVYRMLLTIKNKTVCTRGIRFRDIKPRLTDEWVMFTPVDLNSINPNNGVMELELIASNMYHVGQLLIRRNQDQFSLSMVDMDTYNKDHWIEEEESEFEYAPDTSDHKIEFGDQYITFYPNLDSVKNVSRNSMPKRFYLNRWYSIPEDLGGQGCQLLYLNGVISYDPNGLRRIDDSFKSDYVQELVDFMNTF